MRDVTTKVRVWADDIDAAPKDFVEYLDAKLMRRRPILVQFVDSTGIHSHDEHAIQTWEGFLWGNDKQITQQQLKIIKKANACGMIVAVALVPSWNAYQADCFGLNAIGFSDYRFATVRGERELMDAVVRQ